MSLTDAEQYLIELINRARLDPSAEAKRYGVSLNAGLDAGTIDTSAKQVLAPNGVLEQAAVTHSNWMLDTDTFAHTGANGSSPGARMAAQGYEFNGKWTWRENLAWLGTTGSINMAEAIEGHHEGLYRSAGHRANTFATSIREIGVGQVSGKFTIDGTTYNSSMLTEKFAATGTDVFITGVAYRDADGDGFYGIGEGRSQYWVKGGGDSAAMASAGGYAIQVGKENPVLVQVGKDSKTLAKLDVDVTDGNAKLDIVIDKAGEYSLGLSASADLKSGITDAQLLGVGNIDLSGTDAKNVLRGNKGNNEIRGEGAGDRIIGGAGKDKLYGNDGNDKIYGGNGKDKIIGGTGKDRMSGQDGNDKIYGGSGADKLFGGGGHDRLDGGKGDDLLWGGSGGDTFVFRGGHDVVKDFQDNTDTLAIERSLVGGSNATVSDVLGMGKIINGDAVFDFGHGHHFKINDVSNLNILANDIDLI